MVMALSAEQWEKLLSSECSKCGCTGLHACIGYRPEPRTPEEEARFTEALHRAFQCVAEEEGR